MSNAAKALNIAKFTAAMDDVHHDAIWIKRTLERGTIDASTAAARVHHVGTDYMDTFHGAVEAGVLDVELFDDARTDARDALMQASRAVRRARRAKH